MGGSNSKPPLVPTVIPDPAVAHINFKGFNTIRKLGVGASGEVFLVIANEDKNFYAIKRITVSKTSEVAKAFAEASLLASLKHKAIVSYKSVFIHQDKLQQFVCIVMEYVEGTTLAEYLMYTKEHHIPLVMMWFLKLLSALECCHKQGIIHRDIKPANILIDKESNLKLVDFGVAKLLEGTMYTKTVTGTPLYMAPELAMQQKYTSNVDIFSLGAVLYEAVTQQPLKEPMYMKIAVHNTAMATLSNIQDKSILQILKKMVLPNKLGASELLQTAQVVGWKNLLNDRPKKSDLLIYTGTKKELLSVYASALRYTVHRIGVTLLLQEQSQMIATALKESLASILQFSLDEPSVFELLVVLINSKRGTHSNSLRRKNGLAKIVNLRHETLPLFIATLVADNIANEEELLALGLKKIILTRKSTPQDIVLFTYFMTLHNNYTILKEVTPIAMQNVHFLEWCRAKNREDLDTFGAITAGAKPKGYNLDWVLFVSHIVVDSFPGIQLTSKLSVCSYLATGQHFQNQVVLECATCHKQDRRSFVYCLPCAKICHKKHDLRLTSIRTCYCNCFVEGKCKATHVKSTEFLETNMAGYQTTPTTNCSDESLERQSNTLTGLSLQIIKEDGKASVVLDCPFITADMLAKNGSGKTIAYFEVVVEGVATSEIIAIGYGSKNHPSDKLPGLTRDSVAIHNHNGMVYNAGSTKTPYFVFSTRDVVGLGATDDKKVYITVNGCFVDFIKKLNLTEAKENLYPIIGLQGKGTKVRVISNTANFCFKFGKISHAIDEKYEHIFKPSCLDLQFCSKIMLANPQTLDILGNIAKSNAEIREAAMLTIIHILSSNNDMLEAHLQKINNQENLFDLYPFIFTPAYRYLVHHHEAAKQKNAGNSNIAATDIPNILKNNPVEAPSYVPAPQRRPRSSTCINTNATDAVQTLQLQIRKLQIQPFAVTIQNSTLSSQSSLQSSISSTTSTPPAPAETLWRFRVNYPGKSRPVWVSSSPNDTVSILRASIAEKAKLQPDQIVLVSDDAELDLADMVPKVLKNEAVIVVENL